MANRREALLTILKMMTTGVVLAGTTAAFAKVLTPEDQKYVTMVNLQISAIAQWKSYGELNWKEPAHAELRNTRTTAMAPIIDTLLGFAMDNFTGDTTSPEAFQATSDLFNRRANLDTLSVDELKKFLEVIVPIAVARYLLAIERISFNPATMKNWDRFSDKYQDLILAV